MVPALYAEHVALVAEGDDLMETHARLRFTPTDSPEHATYRVRLRQHHERLRAHIRAVRNQPRDN